MNKATISSAPAGLDGLAGRSDGPVNLLPRDGEVFLIDQALAPDIADQALNRLLEGVDWRQEAAMLFGRKIPLPRLTAWYGDAGYAYSGIRHDPAAWTPDLLPLKSQVETLTSTSFNSVLINLYRDGRDSMGWHSDDEAMLAADPVIASLSLGATRRFQLKHRESNDRVGIDLGHGSCLIMQGRCQACWRHQVPKTRKQVPPRINLTFRQIMPADA